MRAITAAAVSLACLIAAILASSAGASINSSRAIASYDTMQHALVGATSPEAWPVSQALAASIAVQRVSGGDLASKGVATGLQLLSTMRTGTLFRSKAKTGDVYFDDNEWIAQDLLDLGDAASVRRAGAIFAAVVRAWDGNSTQPCAGGIYWTTAAGITDRNTVTTANAALLGLRLYAITHDPRLLSWAQRMLVWENACMRGPDGLYWDHVDASGNVDRTEWSYNQGLLIGAYVQLYAATQNPSALADAESIADATLSSFSKRWLTSEPPEFAAVFFRHLLELAAVDGRQRYVAAAERYGAQAWAQLRDPGTGLFAFPGSDPLLVQASFVQLYASLALMETQAAGSRSQPPAAAQTGQGSDGAPAGHGRGTQAPRTPPGQAGRSGRPSRTSR